MPDQMGAGEEDDGQLSGGASTLGGLQRKKALLVGEGVKDFFFFYGGINSIFLA